MFLKSKRWYSPRDGQQHAKGEFLMLFSRAGVYYPDHPYERLYACVRTVQLDQCGHWMMGTANIAGQEVTVSGTYGDDGLPMRLEDEKVQHIDESTLVPVPSDLGKRFWTGGGHNEAGSELGYMHEWAVKNASLLRKAGKKRP